MKRLPEDLQAHLQTGATTLCWCWRLTRGDGVKMGFTDHDRDVAFEGVTYEAAAGFSASEMRDSIGLSVDNLEVTSALSSDRLSEADLAAGRYDDARVDIFRVNWAAPEQRVLMRSGSLGEVRRAGLSFTAEVRGLAHYLQQPKGRLYQFTCDADVGDGRCGVSLSDSAYRGEGEIVDVSSARLFTVSGLEEFADGWFARGALTFTSGAAEGQTVEVRAHTQAGEAVRIELWAPARGPLVAEQTFVVTAGCDKHCTTCAAKFGNAPNFRGFPHMPGNDFLTTFGRRGV
ncbi:DUF2163 domain-containing protein [Hyphomicrobium sulfonivorans]|uniref:DUF2163 domain-containing protein n=1 Tax=Hyphomicrobium sulfonivorans TaxID=121290 RepID=UPI00156E3DA6|nr:DUF2163 domain-containing protein [Hyphomicrobium sulfonivorans]MBI1650823.1 DUF2163 domain-containing protein [Hyphomicrobium sulfonivorans]NSL71821.1 beta-tubulin [Hyphomicrobium sulfonivorans]